MSEAEQTNEPEQTNEASACTDDAGTGEVGNMESAGETVAADAIGGASDTRPVGEDSLANIDIAATHEAAEDRER